MLNLKALIAVIILLSTLCSMNVESQILDYHNHMNGNSVQRIEKLQNEKGYLTMGHVWSSLNYSPSTHPDSFDFFIKEDLNIVKRDDYWIQFCVVHEDLQTIVQNIWKYGDLIIVGQISGRLYEATNLRTQTTVHVLFNDYPYIEPESSWE